MELSRNYIFFDFQKDKIDVKQDFTKNLIKTLVEVGMKKSSAKSVAMTLYQKMCYSKLHYHTPVHILSMFQFLQENNIEIDKIMELAIWFHDAIYYPNSDEFLNEFRSMNFMSSLIDHHITDLNREDFDKIRILIRITADYFPLDSLNDFKKNLIRDIDICNFAWPEDKFLSVRKCVKREIQGKKSDQEFNIRTKNFFSIFLNRQSIFRTGTFSKFESKARENLENFIANSVIFDNI